MPNPFNDAAAERSNKRVLAQAREQASDPRRIAQEAERRARVAAREEAPAEGAGDYLKPGDLFWGVCRAGHTAASAVSVLRSDPEKVALVIDALERLKTEMDSVLNDPSSDLAALRDRTSEPARVAKEAPTYHDLFITTASIARTSIFNLPYAVRVMCSRVSGWEVWAIEGGEERKLAGEYALAGLRLDVAGHVICDSLSNVEEPEA